ncbi:MAG: hypothetical protein ACYDHN_03515 [Solirubrobacteraceae bacterium]
MHVVRWTLAIGLALIVTALCLVLSGSPSIVKADNGVKIHKFEYVGGPASICQSEKLLPRDTSAIRESLSANAGPWVAIRVLSGGRVLTRGARAGGWGVNSTVTVPVEPLSAAVHHVRICTTLGATVEPVELQGAVVGGSHDESVGARPIRMRVEYLHPGARSWWSLAAGIARHMGIGHAPGGLSGALIVLLIALVLVGGTSRLITWELR